MSFYVSKIQIHEILSLKLEIVAILIDNVKIKKKESCRWDVEESCTAVLTYGNI
jgi:hypothetical protein